MIDWKASLGYSDSQLAVATTFHFSKVLQRIKLFDPREMEKNSLHLKKIPCQLQKNKYVLHI